jgi:hypothetical protein
VRTRADVRRVLRLREDGLGARRIAARSGVPVGTVKDWLAGRLPRHSRVGDAAEVRVCDRCGHEAHRFEELGAAYLYLLGVYLGDGCISEHTRGVYRLRITLDLVYPMVVDECEAAMREVAPLNRVNRRLRRGNYVDRPEPSYVELSAYSKSWSCLFPQHGAGRKHLRTIELAQWQRHLVQRDPQPLLRGLIHSDGCRFMNTGRGGWICPRYVFTNMSEDIRAIFCWTCDLIGVSYTFAPRAVYVSRKADVARLDEFIGPKGVESP